MALHDIDISSLAGAAHHEAMSMYHDTSRSATFHHAANHHKQENAHLSYRKSHLRNVTGSPRSIYESNGVHDITGDTSHRVHWDDDLDR